MPSPKNSPAPKMPSVMSANAWGTRRRLITAVRAMMPPSPRLWARMMKPAYLIETTIINDQKMSEAMPYTPATVVCAALACWVKITCSA
jgi:hypothetical protein